MIDKWVFALAFWLLAAACCLYVVVLRQQQKQFKNKTELQPLKRMLFGAVLLLIFASLPLMFVYADIVWFPQLIQAPWVTYVAVIGNAVAKVIVALLLIFIYKFRTSDDDKIV